MPFGRTERVVESEKHALHCDGDHTKKLHIEPAFNALNPLTSRFMTHIRTFVALPIFLASAVIWGLDTHTLQAAEPEEKTILVLGDSITAGYGLDPSQAYPALLQKKIAQLGLDYDVVNAGVSGETSAGGLRRISWLLRRPMDVLIVALGGNDGLRGVAPSETKRNLSRIIERAREENPELKIILAGMQMPQNMGEEYTTAFKNLYPEIAEEKNVALVPFLLEGVGANPDMNQPDMIHPNEQGQAQVAENVWPVLADVLEVNAPPTNASEED